MSDKSYVTVEQHQCFVCLTIFDTGSLLLHTKLKAAFEPTTVTGHSLCVECKKHIDDGFVALIGLQREPHSWENPMELPRGKLAWLKASAWPHVFNVPVPDKKICFLTDAALQSIVDKVTPPAEQTVTNGDSERGS